MGVTGTKINFAKKVSNSFINRCTQEREIFLTYCFFTTTHKNFRYNFYVYISLELTKKIAPALLRIRESEIKKI